MNPQKPLCQDRNTRPLIANFLKSTLLILGLSAPGVARADLDILIIGSTHSYSEDFWSGDLLPASSREEPFNPTAIRTQLQEILNDDPATTENVNVEFEDVYREAEDIETSVGGSGTSWVLDYHCYSLAQYFMWPDGRDDRMANLRGALTKQWDFIVILEDPFVLAKFPGMYGEAVRLFHEEIAKAPAATRPELVLMSQWPRAGSSFNGLQFNELTFRAGDSLGLRVVPAGKAWNTLSGKDTSASHPTPKGAYLAAACLFREMTGRAPNTSSHNPYPATASHANTTVTNNAGSSQYAGIYSEPNKFQMKYVRKRQIDFNEYGTSTEEGFFRGLRDAISATNMNHSRRNPPASGNPVDLSYSRGNQFFEEDKRYRVNSAQFDRTYGFPVGDHSRTGPTTMKYGIDKRESGTFYDGTDLGMAYRMFLRGQVEPDDVRATPVRLLWSKMSHYRPEMRSHRDGWHLSNELDRAVGAYMFTLTTGRCPIDDEPADQDSSAWKNWFGRKIGYETAWQMSHVTSRVPGFRVVPTAATASNITPGSSQTLSVRFRYPPTSNVTVNVAANDPSAGSVSHSTLTFTPQNYDQARTVTVSGLSGNTGTFPFDVVLTTSSDDVVFDGLRDDWNFENTRTEAAGITLNKTNVTVAENGGTAQFTVVLDHQPGSNVVLNITNSANSEATAAPSSLTFTNSNWNTPQTITITGINDNAYRNDSAQIIVSVNDAASYDSYDALENQSVQVNCTDDELGALEITISRSSISENGGSSSATVTRTGSTSGALAVTLTSNDTSEATVPGSVTIPSGQATASFTVNAVNDTLLDGNRPVVISASATAHADGSDSIQINDDDNAPPVFGPNPPDLSPASEDSAYSGNISGIATDAEGQTLTYLKVSGPDWLTVNPDGTLSGIPTNDDIGENNFVISVSDGIAPPAETTLSISVTNVNDLPFFLNTTIIGETAYEDLNYNRTLSGSAEDGDSDPLIYTKLGGPAWLVVAPNGTLSGTPNDSHRGLNSFTITVTDGIAPLVQASLEITVEDFIPFVPGLRFHSVSGNINLNTPNTGTEILQNISSKTEDGIANTTTEIFTGQIFDADGSVSFTEHIDDKSRIWIDGVLVLNDDAWRDRASTTNLNLTPGWHDIEIRISNGSGGSGPVSSPGIGFDPAGGTNWETLDGNLLRVANDLNTPPVAHDDAISTVKGFPISMTLIATDSEETALSYRLVGGPTSGTLGGTASNLTYTPNPAFTGRDTFTFDANDGNGDSNLATITIDVREITTAFDTWTSGTFANPFHDRTPGGNSDGDSLTNLIEFAFGMDPTSASGTMLTYQNGGEVMAPGIPILEKMTDSNGSTDYRPVFLRRRDHLAAGLVYQAQFSADLKRWTTVSEAPTSLTTPNGPGLMDAVTVSFPNTVPLQGSGTSAPTYFRVLVTME